MGILDEAIREHLELKRQHGVGDSELKQLEDEAFGPPERPGDELSTSDPFAEAPTQFIAMPEVEGEAEEAEGESPFRRESLGIADLQEPPPSLEPVAKEPYAAEFAEEEQPAMEHETVPEAPPPPPPEAPPPTGPTTEERHVIAEQPTELFDVEGEVAAAPSDEELAEEEMAEPRLAPADPLASLAEAEAEGRVEVSAAEQEDDDEDDEFFDQQRLSDELDQALEAPLEEEESKALEEPEVEVRAEVEVDRADDADDEEVVEDLAVEDEDEGEPGTGPAEPGGVPGSDHEDDVLEDTPDFLEDSDDDQLWFEQKPPKDFDFDD
jgi:hypothetical protein